MGVAGRVRRDGGVVLNPQPARGELWWCEISREVRRPVVVLTRDAAAPHLQHRIVAPCTTTMRAAPSEVVLDPAHDPAPMRCAVNLDLVASVAAQTLVERLGRLSDQRMQELCIALGVAVGCD